MKITIKEGTKMDANRLIAEVHRRPALWNQKHILYHNREVTNRIWMELAVLMRTPKMVLKSKWKGLRDTFRSEIKKEQLYQKKKSSRNHSTWMHYKSLYFLKEQMLPRPPIWERSSEGNETQNPKILAENTDDSSMKTKESGSEFSGSPTTNTTQKPPKVAAGTANGFRIILAKNSSQQPQKSKTSLISRRTENNELGDSNTASKKNKSIEMTKIMKSQLVFSNSGTVLGTTYQVVGSLNDQVVSRNILGKSPTITRNPEISNNDYNEMNSESIKQEPPDHDSVACSTDFEVASGNFVDSSGDHGEEMLQNVSPEQVLLASENSQEIANTETEFNPLEANKLDDNYYFLMSLLPHIRKLSGEGRMLLRMKMQELVYKEVYKKS